MKENFIQLIELYDIYSELLSKNEKESFEMYYCDDLSLSEIAENLGISRQGVRDNIVRAEKSLLFFDEKLKLKSKIENVNSMLQKAIDKTKNGNVEEAINILKNIEL